MPSLNIVEVPLEFRKNLLSLLDQSFTGIYRWHARRILRTVRWVREAIRGDSQAGLTMLAMLGQSSGYVYYLAVTPSQRRAGIGGLLLDDAIQHLRAARAREILACIREDNAPSIRLFQSREFMRTSFRELVRLKGFMSAAFLWMHMVAAPGERVFIRIFRD